MNNIYFIALVSLFFVASYDAATVESRVCNGNGCKNCPDASDKCGNGVCDLAFGENCDACPQDCGACVLCPTRKCGNGVCDSASGEDGCNCPQDCKGCCQDGLCLAGESFSSCPADCAASINGQVVDSFTGNPVNGATVRCGVFKQNLSTTIVSDANGNFAITGVSPGPYECVASLGGTVSSIDSFNAFPGSYAFKNKTEVIVLDLETGLLTGTTYFKVGPTVLPGVVVVCRNAESRREVTSDASGRFFLTGVRPGVYTCDGNAAGYSSVTSIVQVNPNSLSSVDVYVDVLRGNIDGSVVNSLSGLNVDSVVTCKAGNVTLTQTTTNGTFYFQDVLPGRADCNAAPLGTGWIGNSAFGIVPGGLNLTLNINVSQVLSNITGKVVNSDTASVIPSADVSCSSPAILLVGLTASDGTFGFNSLPAGIYTCVARRGGFATSTVGNISVGTNALINTGSIGLKGLPGAVQIFLTSTRTSLPVNGTLVCSDVTSAVIFNGTINGPIVLSGIIPGNLTCVASAPGFVTSTVVRTVSPSIQSDFGIQLGLQTSTLGGTVSDSLVTSTVVRGAIITCSSVDLDPVNFYTATTNANGLYNIPKVILGTYGCIATAPSYNPTIITNISVTPTGANINGTAAGTFSMVPIPAKISGRVLDSLTDNPLPVSSRVTCSFQLANSAPILTSLIGTDGLFFFDNITFYGPWRCVVVASGYSHSNGRGFYPLATDRGVVTSAKVLMTPAPGVAQISVVDSSKIYITLSAAKVFCKSADGTGDSVRVFLDANGVGNYTNVRGAYVCTASLDPGYAPITIPAFTINPGDYKRVTIAMQPIPGSLLLVVVDTSTTAISGARVVCTSAPAVFSSITGQALVPSLAGGPVTCQISAVTFRDSTISANINNGLQTTVRVVLSH